MASGVVYTETVVHAAPEAFVAEAPYQIAIVTLEDGSRTTMRIIGERVGIGDRVVEEGGVWRRLSPTRAIPQAG